MAREGAHIIDIGGESTRPGAPEVPAEVECGTGNPGDSAATVTLGLPNLGRYPQGDSCATGVGGGSGHRQRCQRVDLRLRNDRGNRAPSCRGGPDAYAWHTRDDDSARPVPRCGGGGGRIPGRACAGGPGGRYRPFTHHSGPRHWICQENESQFEVDSSDAAVALSGLPDSCGGLAQKLCATNCRRRPGATSFWDRGSGGGGGGGRSFNCPGPRPGTDSGGGQDGGGDWCGGWSKLRR